MTPTQAEKSRSLLEAAEARMRQAETFAWAVPALALTAQALLLTVAFGDSATPTGRVFASGTGLAILLAALHLLGKHTFNFDMYEAVIDREREDLHLPPVSRDKLLEHAESFPEHTGFSDRQWLATAPIRGNWARVAWVRLRKRLVVNVRAVHVWSVALGLLALSDLGVFVYSLICLVRQLF